MEKNEQTPNQQEDPENSVQQSHDFTTGRAESEGRIGSGNRRQGQAATESEVAEFPGDEG